MTAVVGQPAVTRAEQARVRRFTSTMFAAAALAFLLPFGTVSCGEETVTVTGVELATYSVEGGDEPRALASEVEAHGDLALIALVAALVGGAVASVRDRGGGYAIVGLCALFALRFNPDTVGLLGGGPEVESAPGYFLACSFLSLAGLTRWFVRLTDARHDGRWIAGLFLGAPATALLLFLLGVGAR